VGGGSTLRRFAALYSERLRSLRRALNMNAKYAGDSRTLRGARDQRAVQCAYFSGVMFDARLKPPSRGMGGLIGHASAATMA